MILVRSFLICWIVPTVLVFELVATKLPHYTFPTYPAIAVLTGLFLSTAPEIVAEGRRRLAHRVVATIGVIVTVVLAAAVLVGLVVTGPAAEAVGNAVGLGSTAVLVWGIAKRPVMLVVVGFMIALLYYATPNVQQPKMRWVSPGAALAIVVWGLASAAFGFYIANFSSYDKTYGSLAGVVVFLLWLWLTNLALLFCAALDALLERGRELVAGMAAG